VISNLIKRDDIIINDAVWTSDVSGGAVAGVPCTVYRRATYRTDPTSTVHASHTPVDGRRDSRAASVNAQCPIIYHESAKRLALTQRHPTHSHTHTPHVTRQLEFQSHRRASDEEIRHLLIKLAPNIDARNW
jgi:hypothetical protein